MLVYNIQMDQWESIWLKGLKFTLSYNLTENFFKMMFHWYMPPEILLMMYTGTSNYCWKCEKHEGTFYHA